MDQNERPLEGPAAAIPPTEARHNGTQQRIEFDSPEEARGFIAGVRFMDPWPYTVKADLEAPLEPWSHGKTGKWIVVVAPVAAPK